MKCKDFHIEVEEGLKGESLSILAQDHAASCHPCREFNQKHVEFREWLMVCEKITAPKDFQFGVQRKIASSSTAHPHSWAWSRLRYIVPATALAAILALAGNYALNWQNAPDNGSAAIHSETETRDPNTAQTQDTAANSSEVSPENEKLAVLPPNANKQESNARVVLPKENVDLDKGLGSRDQGAVNNAPLKYPKGIDPSSNSPANRSKTLIALSALGAKASVEDMRILLVVANTPAARAGVKAGDVVQSLDGNVLTIKRGGKTRQITIE